LNLATARTRAYLLLDGVTLEGAHRRSDIALAAAEGRLA
jgi:hypothetical protein